MPVQRWPVSLLTDPVVPSLSESLGGLRYYSVPSGPEFRFSRPGSRKIRVFHSSPGPVT